MCPYVHIRYYVCKWVWSCMYARMCVSDCLLCLFTCSFYFVVSVFMCVLCMFIVCDEQVCLTWMRQYINDFIISPPLSPSMHLQNHLSQRPLCYHKNNTHLPTAWGTQTTRMIAGRATLRTTHTHSHCIWRLSLGYNELNCLFVNSVSIRKCSYEKRIISPPFAYRKGHTRAIVLHAKS